MQCREYRQLRYWTGQTKAKLGELFIHYKSRFFMLTDRGSKCYNMRNNARAVTTVVCVLEKETISYVDRGGCE